jgi:hypothetical protein
MDLLISAVNEADLGWKADVCKYQKHHANYGAHCDKPVMLAQTGSKDDENQDEANIQTAIDKNENFGNKDNKEFMAALEKAQKYMKSFKNSQDIPDSELPDSLDFRNIDGFDFTSYFRDQGHCGSCFTISFTQVMEARMKLKYGKSPPMLSP